MRRLLALAPFVLVAGLTAGCGGTEGGVSVATVPRVTTVEKATIADFPRAGGKRLSELRQGLQDGLVLAPSVSVFTPGRNRYGFAIFDVARKQVADAPVAVYVSNQDGTGVRGPFMARSESLAVKPQYQSRTTQADPDAAKSVYVADVAFPRAGKYRVSAIARLDGRSVATSSFTAVVAEPGAAGQPPAPGEVAPRVETPTLASVAGDAARISTRTPPAKDLLTTNLADVYGKKPVALLFATPALCQSRVCGPVVDILEEVRAELGDKDVAFVTSEIYKENRIDLGLRPQPTAYRIPTEPWLFVLDRQGRVAERIEGAFSAAELRAAIRRAEQAG